MKGKVIVTMQFLLIGLLIFYPTSNGTSMLTLVLATGMALFALYIIFRSFRDLGDSLTVMPESKKGASLVTSGIYRKVRHPIYSALFLLGISAIIWKQSLVTLLWALLLLFLLLYKARYEDSLLREKFPDALNYQRSTPPFFPKRHKENDK